MTATIELTEIEIMTAVREYVEKSGWNIQGSVILKKHPGCGDQRDYQAPYVTAVMSVSK